MKALAASALFFAATLLTALTSQAQVAYTRVVMPEDIILSANIDVAAEGEAPRVLYGVVQGASGVLPGATVWLNGSKTVAVANSEGVFELPVPSGSTEVEVTCSYAGLEEETVKLPVDDSSSTLYLLRPRSAQGKRFASDLTLKDRCDLLVKKVRNAGK